MKRFFEVTARAERVTESGLGKMVNEIYLVDALSFSEAETKVVEELRAFTSSEFGILKIKYSNVDELVLSEYAKNEEATDFSWYKCKVNLLVINEQSGKEKKQPFYLLVWGDSPEHVLKSVVDHMKGTIADYEVDSISNTEIMDVFCKETNSVD